MYFIFNICLGLRQKKKNRLDSQSIRDGIKRYGDVEAGEASVRRHTHGRRSVRSPSHTFPPPPPPPRQFEGTSELWPRWRTRFQRYRLCSGLSDKPNSEQVGTLLYTKGDVADDVLAVIKLDETSCTFDEVMAALDGYFNSRKNTIFPRAKFNRRVQQPGESVDAFIQDLHRLADECSYSTLKNELIRN